MKHNFMTKMVSALLAVVLSTAAFSIAAFASGGEESTKSVAEQETAGDVVLCQVLEQLKCPFFFVTVYATTSTISLLAIMLFTSFS